MKVKRQAEKMGVLYLFFYGIVSFSFLTKYPFVHSDESWLAGLSRDMMAEGSLAATESFFDARPRYPHAVKSLFHLLQMVFIQLFGYSINSVRLLSLTAGLIFLVLFYFLVKRLTGREKLALGLTVLFSLDSEFIYASHFARQEIFIGVFLLLGLLLLAGNSQKQIQPPGIKATLLAAVVTGISVGFHPNSFLLACSFGCILLFFYFSGKKTVLFAYIVVTGGIAGIFVIVSYFFDSSFLAHYLQNGAAEFSIDASIAEKTGELGGFFSRLFEKNSGTYYITELRFSLLLFAFLAVFMAFYALVMKDKKTGAVLLGALGILVGTVIIGRYNQTSIFFFYPFGYLLLGLFLAQLEKPGRYIIFAAVFGVTLFISGKEITPWIRTEGYEAYLCQLEELVPAGKKVLANLNTGFYFDQGCLRDYRNLPYAQEEGGLAAYIEENGFEYILYSEELTYLYEHRPYYNVIYGTTLFVPQLKEFCEKQGTVAGVLENREYASRVRAIMGQEEYSRIIVYKIGKDKDN